MNEKNWPSIQRSLSFEFVRTGKGILENTPRHRDWTSRPEHVVAWGEVGGMDITIQGEKSPILQAPGDCVYIPAGLLRRSILKPENGLNVVCFCHFNFRIFGNLDFMSFLELPNLYKGQSAEGIKSIVTKMDEIHTDKKLHPVKKAVAINSLGMRLLNTLVKISTIKPSLNEFLGKKKRFADVFKHISNNLERNLSVDELAAKASLSPSSFHRNFKKITGLTPKIYARTERMRKAAQILTDKDTALAEIADELGYADQFSFSKAFKKCFGRSPAEFRKNPWREF